MVFTIKTPNANNKSAADRTIPLLVSVPHCGITIPDALRSTFRSEFHSTQPDTDWLVHELYNFVPEIGGTLIHANLSRYVIDLNRDPSGSQLYKDGRRETTLVPTLTFDGRPIYAGAPPDEAEIKRRIDQYHAPYYAEISRILNAMRKVHRNVLFFDAHSIKRVVLSISSKPFPDMILGSNDGKSAATALCETALRCLTETTTNSNPYQVTHNQPFKGGYLTRFFGQPQRGIHALQLEMAQDIYLDESKLTLNQSAAEAIRPVLRNTLVQLCHTLEELP